MKKLCVFPNDPLKSYFKKGEIKPRYFNPNNIFDEVHVISLFDDDIEEEKVNVVAGNALFYDLASNIATLNRPLSSQPVRTTGRSSSVIKRSYVR